MEKKWMIKKEEFTVMDVREAKGTFLPGLLKKAGKIPVGHGLCVVQSFEPKPLYPALEKRGFDYETEKVGDTEFRSYFYREQMISEDGDSKGEMPFKPTAILNFKKIDDRLAGVVVDYWELIWGQENPAIDLKTKLILSLSNAVGAGRFRQATRELIKAYAIGYTTEEMDELFSLLAWNQGNGYFASEIGPSTLFKVYQTIKVEEAKGKNRGQVMDLILEEFGENNKEISTS